VSVIWQSHVLAYAIAAIDGFGEFGGKGFQGQRSKVKIIVKP